MSAPVSELPAWGQTSVALPQLRAPQTLQSLRSFFCRFAAAISGISGLRFQTRTRRLKLQETVQLGDKRFVAILRVDGEEFLLGGGTAGVSILGQLHPEPHAEAASFASVLRHHATEDPA